MYLKLDLLVTSCDDQEVCARVHEKAIRVQYSKQRTQLNPEGVRGRGWGGWVKPLPTSNTSRNINISTEPFSPPLHLQSNAIDDQSVGFLFCFAYVDLQTQRLKWRFLP